MLDPNGFFASLGRAEYFACALALVLTLLMGWAARAKRGLRLLLAAWFLPLPAVALFSTQFNIVGWHAFMHASPIYQIMARGGVPEDPLYAGGSLRYPWAEFWLTATLARWTGANPIVLTLLAQTLAYGVLLAAAVRLASSFSRDPITIGLSAMLSSFGISVFHSSLVEQALERAFPPLWLETRVVPLDKFLSVTAMPLGYAGMLVAMAAGLQLVSADPAANPERDRQRLLAIAAGTLIAVFIHPLSWLGILLVEAVVAVVLLFFSRGRDWKRVARLALAVGIPSVLALPYLHAVGASESSQGRITFTHSLDLFEAKLADLGFFLALFGLLAYLHRAELLRRLRAGDRPLWVILAAIAGWAIAYLAISAPGRNEYKFLLQLAPAAAVPMALSLRALLDRHRALALGLVFLLLLPGGRMLGVRPWFEVTDPARLVGQYQRALDPVADELYQWVATQTPQRAVFVAADLRVPPLGRRSLFVAVDAPWQGRDGWGLVRNSLLQWHVRRADSEMYRRQQLATIVLSPGWALPPAQVMEEMARAVPDRPIFVHASSPAVAAKLDATPGFRQRFANRAGAIYEWLGPA